VLVTQGRAVDGQEPAQATIVDAATMAVMDVERTPADQNPPRVTGSIPAAGAADVPLTVRLAVRFSEALLLETVTAETIRLVGPRGPVNVRVVGAEGGRLAFVWPLDPLDEGETYVLTVEGPTNVQGVQMVPASIGFRTARAPSAPADSPDAERWTPTDREGSRGWQTERPPSPWETLAPLLARPGVSAISGRVLRLDGRPLGNVTLAIEGHSTRSDRTGRFLLEVEGLVTGVHTLVIDARTANRPGREYGYYQARITAAAGQTTVLPFSIWSPLLDTRHQVTIPSPTTAETVLTNPAIPGLELHLPAGSVIRDENHQVVRTLTLTPVPLDRTPFPLPGDAEFTMYFTIQPGGAYIATYGPNKGAWLVYPNVRQSPDGKRVQFFNYDPEELGWHPYGMGTVAGTSVIPDPTTRIYAFTGASYNDGTPPAPGGSSPENGRRGDPVDPSTGAFIMTKTDLFLPDVMPLALTRTYNSQDPYDRAFGIGMTHNFGLIQHSQSWPAEADLYLPNGARLHFDRLSDPGVSSFEAVWEHSASSTPFYKSLLTFWGSYPGVGGWQFALPDGTIYKFGHVAPLQAIRDRHGNEIRLTWSETNQFESGYGQLIRITSPNGRWISLTYDENDRVTEASDNIGRTVTYTYDEDGRLETVTDPENNVTTYTYDSSDRMLTITDGRDITYLTNTYADGRVATQDLADPNATYEFDYTVDGSGNITQTDVTDPRGTVERLTFNSDHYTTAVTEAYGTALARTTTIERESGSNLIEAIVDPLERRTEYTYDDTGHVLTITRLADSEDAVTTTLTYEPQFFQLASITDPLDHVWTIGYDASGRLASLTDPLSHGTTIGTNSAGQVTSVTDPLSHTWEFAYTGGDVTSVTNPLSSVRTQFVDAGGRAVSVRDPFGRTTATAFDDLNRVTSVTDAHGGQTTFTYDENSNLLTLTDPLSHTTTYTYDNFDRVATRTDPLSNAASYDYDFNGNLIEATDREAQVTAYTYDALNRLTEVTFDDTSTIEYTYDAGDRLTQIVDSVNGTIIRKYDGLDRLTEETTPQGTITYTYDDDGRRATMTVDGQTTVSYTYDAAHRLTAITQGSASVAITYDNADRRSTVTFPNEIVATYGYDNANQLTSLTYTLDETTLGTLTYTYDLAGNRTSVGGTWARTGLPSALSSAEYDAANRLTDWDSTSFTYDDNGNLTGDGTTTYIWNARGQLTGLSGGASASFQYDGLGRRRGKTIASTTTQFLYDGLNLVQELNSGGTPTANVLTGLGIDETFTRALSGGTETLLGDALGSTIALADGDGDVRTEYTFDPFGATTTSGASSTNAAQFTGRENDLTGLSFYRARFYNPQLQRFVSEDPAGEIAGPNLYTYVGNAPTNWVDPLGLQQVPPPVPVPGGGPGTNWQWNPDPGNPRGGTWGPNPRIPGQSQPSGSWDSKNNHWDIDDGFGNRNRVDPTGNPLTPDDAHPRPRPEPNPSPTPRPNRPVPEPPLFPWLPWRLPFPFPLIINPCLIDPFLPVCNPMLPQSARCNVV
jgi:RHS repeat-associated protein